MEMTRHEPRTSSANATRNSANAKFAPPIVHDVLRSRGTPLPTETLHEMNDRFGHDFGNVRIHADATAARSADAVNAAAYAVGPDIVFGQNRFEPKTDSGRRLLGHELVHTIQQPKAEPSVALPIASREDPFEATATSIAGGVFGSHTNASRSAVGASLTMGREPRLFRQAKDSEATPEQDRLGFELEDVAPKAETRELRVEQWLKSHRQTIESEASIRGIDPRAVAGAIAWEALENPITHSFRGVGPGKVHVTDVDPSKLQGSHKESRKRFWGGYSAIRALVGVGRGTGVAPDVEDRYSNDPDPRKRLPQKSISERKEALTDPETSIRYIAAIMGAYAEEAEKAGECIYGRPEILATYYQGAGVSISTIGARVRQRRQEGQSLDPNPGMGTWVSKNLPMLERSVGNGAPRKCQTEDLKQSRPNESKPTPKPDPKIEVKETVESVVRRVRELAGNIVAGSPNAGKSDTLSAGASIGGSVVGLTSGGGGTFGLNFQGFVRFKDGQIADIKVGLYEYHTREKDPATGFSVGGSAEGNVAVGHGEWTGAFDSISGNKKKLAWSVFQSGELKPGVDPGFQGISGGSSFGADAGLAVVRTNYTAVAEFSIAEFSAELERAIYRLYGVPQF